MKAPESKVPGASKVVAVSELIKTLLAQELSTDFRANGITRLFLVFCIGNVLPTGEKDLEFKPEPSALALTLRHCRRPGEER